MDSGGRRNSPRGVAGNLAAPAVVNSPSAYRSLPDTASTLTPPSIPEPRADHARPFHLAMELAMFDVWAASRTEAARKALAIQRDPNSIATVFEVFSAGQVGPEGVDLQKGRADGEMYLSPFCHGN